MRLADDSSQSRSIFAGRTLYADPNNDAADTADDWKWSDPHGAAIMDDLATVPQSLWLGDWNWDVEHDVDSLLDRAAGKLVTFVVYNIPNRDCGNFSAGGASGRTAYLDFVDDVAAGLNGRSAIVVLEPDALGVIDCLSDWAQGDREDMMADAVVALTDAGASVYIDAGDSAWVPASDMADRLERAGVHDAAGFALNVSHTEYTYDEIDYAYKLRSFLGDGARYVIDTGRNGVGPTWDNQWCNPLGRKNGKRPTLTWTTTGLDALLWIKQPGGSDGWCNGGPEAGSWWPEYARNLAE
ncbi:MAG: glycoside hydrolase family 6 protein [Myxococcota bacterium]